MEGISDEDLNRALEAACVAASEGDQPLHLVSVASRLRQGGLDDESPIGALVAALEYHLVMRSDRRGSHGAYGPMWEADGRRYPAPVAEIGADVLALWARAADQVSNAFVSARFADLLWEARFGERPDRFARTAIERYVAAAADDSAHPGELTDGLQRALELAAQLRDADAQARVAAACEAFILKELESSEDRPGVALRLIDSLVSLSTALRPAGLGALTERALDRYGADAWHLEAINDMRARLVPPADRRALHAESVDAFANLARRSEPGVKFAHYQHAIELAELHGLRDQVEALRAEVEALSVEELGLERISAQVDIPREVIDQWVAAIVGDDGIEHALQRFGSHIPIGTPDENRGVVQQMMADHPLQFLFTRTVLGPNNSVVRIVEGEDEQAAQALLDHEAQLAAFFAPFAVEMLSGIIDRYGPLSVSWPWFESEMIEHPVAERIGRALEHYEAGDWDSSAALLAPRLERIVRRIATLVGLTVTKGPDRSGRSGGVKGLGELLGLLEGRLPEPTRRYLRILLAEVTGLNLRNRVGHALSDYTSQQEAALLVHAVCHLRLLVGERQGENADGAASAS